MWLFSFDADAQPPRQCSFGDDDGKGDGQESYDAVDGHDVQTAQENMKVRCQMGEQCQKQGMDQIDGIGVIAQERKDFIHRTRHGTALPPVQAEQHRRQSINHSYRTELVDGKHGRQGIIALIVHDAVISGQHACCGKPLEEIDQKSVIFKPVADGGKVFCRKSAEQEDEQIMKDDVIEAVIEGILQNRAGKMKIPDITGIEVKYHVGEKENGKGQGRFLIHPAQKRPPEGHEKIEPQENDEKIDMIHGQAVPECTDELSGMEQSKIMADDGNVQHVK